MSTESTLEPRQRGRYEGDVRPITVGAGGTTVSFSRPGAIILLSHDEEFVRQLAPTKVLLMPDGDVDYFNEEWLDLVSLA